jgi:hypothetical protein
MPDRPFPRMLHGEHGFSAQVSDWGRGGRADIAASAPLRQRGSPWMVGLPADAGLECKLPTGPAEQDGHLGGWLPEKVPAFLIAGKRRSRPPPGRWRCRRIRCDLDGPVATITLARPDRRNAQTPVTWAALRTIGSDLPGEVRVVVVRAEAASFPAGLDRAMFWAPNPTRSWRQP